MSRTRNSLPDSKEALVLLAAAVTLCYLLVVRLLGLAIEGATGGSGAYSVLVYPVALLLCFGAYKLWAPEPQPGSMGLLPSGGLALLAGVAACAVGMIPGAEHVLPPTALNIVCVGVAAPIAEELLFRGLILGRLEASAGMPFALAVSSVLFAVAHIGSGGVLVVLVSGIAGLLFGAVYLKCRSTIWAIVAHIASNLLTFALIATLG